MNCSASFKSISIPTLIIQSKNDPAVVLEAYPWRDIESNDNIISVITPNGSHGHFLTTNTLMRWFKKPTSEFFKSVDDWNSMLIK